MKLYRFLVVCIIFFCITLPLFGQKHFREGYVVKNNGDTLNGLIEFKEIKRPAQTVNFKRFDIAIPVNYNIENIIAYGYKNGNHYDLKRVDGEKLFIECLVKGKISLYQYSKKLYIEKDDISLTELSKGNITTYTQVSINDYADYLEFLDSLTNDIEGFSLPSSLALKAEELVSIIIDYNAQSDNHYWVYERQFDQSLFDDAILITGASRSSYGIITSVKLTNSTLNATGRYLLPNPGLTKSKGNFSIGGLYSYQVSRMVKNIRLVIEGHFSHNTEKYYLKIYKDNPYETLHIDISEKDVNLFIPIFLQFTKSYNKITPYVNLGLTNELTFRKENGGLLEIENQQYEVFTYDVKSLTPKSSRNHYVYPIISLGVKYRIASNLVLFVESRTNIGFSSSKAYDFTYYYTPTIKVSNQTPLSFLLGIEF